MEEITAIREVVGLISDGGVLVILVFAVWGFWTGKIMSRKTHEEIDEKQGVILDHLIEKINGSFDQQNEQQGEFIKRVDTLAQDYFIFQKDIRKGMNRMEEVTPKLLDTLESIDDQLKKQNGE
jgi:hypothetical protein